MYVVYKDDVFTSILDAKRRAANDNKMIDKILVTQEEWDELVYTLTNDRTFRRIEVEKDRWMYVSGVRVQLLDSKE